MSPRTRPLMVRFWEKVDKNGPLILPTRCWVWTAKWKTSEGYGRLWVNRKAAYPHRLSFEMHNGPIESGMKVCHRCDNPPCVNPEHLFAGTTLDNAKDCVAKGRIGNRRGGKITPHQKAAIRGLRRSGRTIRTIAAETGWSIRTIGRICAST